MELSIKEQREYELSDRDISLIIFALYRLCNESHGHAETAYQRHDRYTKVEADKFLADAIDSGKLLTHFRALRESTIIQRANLTVKESNHE